MNSDDIVQGLCGAIDTILQSALKNLNYDKTVIGTIIDDTKATNGEYQVTVGASIYWVKSENTSYVKNDQVRITIPNGDATQEKFIAGKYISKDSNVPITYMNPVSQIMIMTDNLFSGNEATYGLTANKGVDEVNIGGTQSILTTIDLQDSNQSHAINSKLYDTIFIQADFKTLLQNYNIISGKYGLRLKLGQMDSTGKNFTSVVECVFDSSQMLGNPYSFGIYTQQAATFDVSDTGPITSIQVQLYQDGNFKHNTYGIEEFVPINQIANNILVKNITIGFGANLINVADNTVKLFTLENGLTYNTDSTEEEKTKTLSLAWFNKDDSGRSIGFTDGISESNIIPNNVIGTIKNIDGKNIKFIDEKKYCELSAKNARLSQQANYNVPMDETGLEIAARVKEIHSTLKTLSSLLSKDLYQTFQKFIFNCQLDALKNTFNNSISKLIADQIVIIDKTAVKEEDKIKNLLRVADDIQLEHTTALNRAAARHNKDILPETLGDDWTFITDITDEPTLNTGYFSNIVNYIENVRKSIYGDGQTEIFLSALLDEINTKYGGFKGIYDSYEYRIDAIWKKINDTFETFKSLWHIDDIVITQKLSAYFGDYKFNGWKEVDLSAWDNAYSIYWYKTDNTNKIGDIFMPSEWSQINLITNEQDKTPDYSTYDKINVLLDSQKRKEEYKVLVFFNHKKYESNNLIFENTTNFDELTSSKLDYITLSHGTNSLASYQLYGVTNTLLNGAEKYKQRTIKCSFTKIDAEETVTEEVATVDEIESTFSENDKYLEGAQIYWYIPKNSTMLDFNLQDLNKLSDNRFVNDISHTQQFSNRQKAGYYSFYKTIKKPEDLNFSYRIKEYYSDTASQNHIICDVYKGDNIYTDIIDTKFSSYGTSGTDYTLTVEPQGSQAGITASNSGNAENGWKLNIALYNANNELIPFPKGESALTVKLLNSNSSYYNAGLISTNANGTITYGIYTNIPSGKESSWCDILEVKVTGMSHSADGNNNKVDLTTYFPIPYTADEKYYIAGASYVIYDSMGGNPAYYKDSYEIFKQQETAPSGVTWSLKNTCTQKDNKNNNLGMNQYSPELTNDNKLKPKVMWIENSDVIKNEKYFYYVECVNSENIVIWRQPLVIMQNRYPSPMLNVWDGSLKIDEENGTIMSTMVGAGRKTSNNTFEGVLMGDVSFQNVPTGKHSGLGLYGFHDGSQSFGFNIDGTAFIGKSGHGRIEFNGNNGTIKSASYDEGKLSGMKIDLDDGQIHIKGGQYLYNKDGSIQKDSNNQPLYSNDKNTSRSQIILNAQSPYFNIISKNGNNLIFVGDTDYYLQTDNFNNKNAGIKLDLKNGQLLGYDFILKALDDGNSGVIVSSNGSSDCPYLQVKDSGGNVLMNVTNEKFILQSHDWSEDKKAGTQINLMPKENESTLKSYNFNLLAYNGSDEQFIWINSIDIKSPFNVNNKFKINWDGSFTVNNGVFSVDADGNAKVVGDITAGEGSIGGWHINDNALLTKSIYTDNAEIIDDTISGIISTNDNFTLNQDDASHDINIMHNSLITITEQSPIKFFAGWDVINSSMDGQNGLYIANNAKFMVLNDGSLYAKAASIQGTIIAQNGLIGGWEITPTQLKNYSGERDENGYYLNSFCMQVAGNGATNALVIGRANENWWGHAAFRVTVDGKLYATDAEISGTIISNGGKIGGFYILDNNLENFEDDNPTIKLGIKPDVIGPSSVFDGIELSKEGLLVKNQEREMVKISLGVITFRSKYDEMLVGPVYLPEIRVDSNIGWFTGSWKTNSAFQVVSDKNEKNNINTMAETYDTIFDNLKPRIFKYNDSRSNRYHTGFIAQEVDEARNISGLTRQDFAAICVTNEGTLQERWGLRYSEFISLNTWQIQRLKSRVKILEDEIIELKKIIKG